MDTSHLSWRKASYSNNGASCVEVAVWRKASYSNNSANCVEVAASHGVSEDALCLVRDTKDRGGPALAFAAAEWAAFTERIKAGEYRRTA